VPRTFSQHEADRHNALCAKANALTKGRLLLGGSGSSRPPNWFDRWQLRRAMRCYAQALAINPEGWPAMWSLGKIHQRLGDQETALLWFTKAHEIQPDQPDVAREASVAALDLGRIDEALALCRSAVASRPGDPGLVCNLALAHCLAGEDAEAGRRAAEAVAGDPTDKISATVLKFVGDVASGKRPRPKRLLDAFPHG